MSDTITPVIQTVLGDGGNCLTACICTITGMDINTFPYVRVNEDNPYWWEDLQAICLGRGWSIKYRPTTKIMPLGYAIVNGMGPRGRLHSCVYFDGLIVHDPHPDGGGLVDERSYYTVTGLGESD